MKAATHRMIKMTTTKHIRAIQTEFEVSAGWNSGKKNGWRERINQDSKHLGETLGNKWAPQSNPLQNSALCGHFLESANACIRLLCRKVHRIDLDHGAAILNLSHWYQCYQTEAGRTIVLFLIAKWPRWRQHDKGLLTWIFHTNNYYHHYSHNIYLANLTNKIQKYKDEMYKDESVYIQG